MAISLNTFNPNTKIESSKNNTNFQNLKTAYENGLKDIIVDTDTTTVTFDLSNKNIHIVTLGGNRTLAVSGATVGQVFLIRLTQGGAGGFTVTWWTGIKWPGGIPPTLTTTPSSTDAFMFICTSANIYDGYFAGFGLA